MSFFMEDKHTIWNFIWKWHLIIRGNLYWIYLKWSIMFFSKQTRVFFLQEYLRKLRHYHSLSIYLRCTHASSFSLRHCTFTRDLIKPARVMFSSDRRLQCCCRDSVRDRVVSGELLRLTPVCVSVRRKGDRVSAPPSSSQLPVRPAAWRS